MTTIADVIEVHRKWLHLPDPGIVEVTFGAVAANRLPGDPVWLLNVGASSSGKTEKLGAASGLPDVHPTATLTQAALLSGTPKKEHATGAKGGLLREVGKFGIIVAKDFTSLLSMNRDSRTELLAALRCTGRARSAEPLYRGRAEVRVEGLAEQAFDPSCPLLPPYGPTSRSQPSRTADQQFVITGGDARER